MPNNSQWRLSSNNAEKVNLGDTRDNDMKTRKVQQTVINIALGKNGCYIPNRLISLGRQAVSETKKFVI